MLDTSGNAMFDDTGKPKIVVAANGDPVTVSVPRVVKLVANASASACVIKEAEVIPPVKRKSGFSLWMLLFGLPLLAIRRLRA